MNKTLFRRFYDILPHHMTHVNLKNLDVRIKKRLLKYIYI